MFLDKKSEKQHLEKPKPTPRYLCAQDIYCVNSIKGVSRIKLQTLVTTYTKMAFVKFYDHKIMLVAAEMLNYNVLHFLEQHGIQLLQTLSD